MLEAFLIMGIVFFSTASVLTIAVIVFLIKITSAYEEEQKRNQYSKTAIKERGGT